MSKPSNIILLLEKDYCQMSPANQHQFNWIFELRRYKTSIVGGVIATLSLSLAHYAGFLMEVPLQIVALAGSPLARGVTTTFLFYTVFCGVSARVIISILQLIMLPLLALNDRLERGFRRQLDFSHQRRFVRSHSQTIKWEGVAWLALQGLAFLILMVGIYVKFTITWISGVTLFGSVIFIVLSGLVRAGFFLQPKPGKFVEKIRSRRSRTGRASSAAFITMTGALLVAAFFLGNMRASLLRDQKAQMVVTKDFAGLATVIAGSDGALLLFQKEGNEFRYIFSSAEYSASIESKPVFPSIATRSKTN